MRSEKFDSTKNSWESDDIVNALDYNPQTNLCKSDIDVIVAEVCGENDGVNWFWIILRKDSKFQYVTGGCDYTGWDCQSHCSANDPVENIEEALAQSPECPDYDNRKIRQCLTRQVNDEIPFAIYQD